MIIIIIVRNERWNHCEIEKKSKWTRGVRNKVLTQTENNIQFIESAICDANETQVLKEKKNNLKRNSIRRLASRRGSLQVSVCLSVGHLHCTMYISSLG